MVSRLGTLAIGIALARILGPEEFGTFAVALLALLAVLSFSELGVSLAIVRWPGSPREIAPTVATISMLSSIVFCVVSVAAAPWFCEVMGAPDATSVVRVLAFSVIISGAVAAPAALLQREFRAGRRMLIDQVSNWLGAIVSIVTAVGGMGAMSLGVGRLAGATAGAVLFIWSEPVRFGWNREDRAEAPEVRPPARRVQHRRLLGQVRRPVRGRQRDRPGGARLLRARLQPLQLADRRLLAAGPRGVAGRVRPAPARSDARCGARSSSRWAC